MGDYGRDPVTTRQYIETSNSCGVFIRIFLSFRNYHSTEVMSGDTPTLLSSDFLL